MANQILIYGANGYTAGLILEQAARRGLQPIIAGRSAAKLAPLAAKYGLSWRCFTLDDPEHIARNLEGAAVVLNCAGPFLHTCQPLAHACMRAQAHYLDITGEIDVFQALAAFDDMARNANIMLMPGCGFDVVPTDCLAAHLHRRMPQAKYLTLAFKGLTRVSRGTAITAVDGMDMGGRVRENGSLIKIPLGSRTRTIDFGRGPELAVAIPWGDVANAYYTTGIPNIEVYVPMPAPLIRVVRMSEYVQPIARSRLLKNALKRLLTATMTGPSEQLRQRGRALVWGQVRDEAGQCMQATLQTQDPYTLTAHTALAIAIAATEGKGQPGYQTPARVFGPDFILQFEGSQREDLP